MRILTQKQFPRQVIPTLLEEAEMRYGPNECSYDGDGHFSVHFRSSIIKYGAYSTLENEASFIMNFKVKDVLAPDGAREWPLCDDFLCEESDKVIKKLADKLLTDKTAKKAFYRGRYYNASPSRSWLSRYEFVFDYRTPTHILFVSDKHLGSAGNLYNCDVITTKNFYALAIPMRTYRYLIRE